MPLERKKTLNVFKEADRVWGSYDDYPVGPPGTDPMPHLSRNRVPQPFFLVCEADQVLIQMAGEGELYLKEQAVTAMHLEPGDTIYLPAGIPSRNDQGQEMSHAEDHPDPDARTGVRPPGARPSLWR